MDPTKAHKPTLMNAIILVIILFVIYHFTLGRKKAS